MYVIYLYYYIFYVPLAALLFDLISIIYCFKCTSWVFFVVLAVVCPGFSADITEPEIFWLSLSC